MLAISARIELDPTSVDAYLEAAQPVISATRSEKGCNQYAFGRDVLEPNVIWICEEWESDADLDAHLRSEHIASFMAAVAELDIRSMDVKKYDVSSVGPVVPPAG